jgi:hypothetical protein
MEREWNPIPTGSTIFSNKGLIFLVKTSNSPRFAAELVLIRTISPLFHQPEIAILEYSH